MTVAQRQHRAGIYPVKGADGRPVPERYCLRVYVGRSATGAALHRSRNFRGPKKAAQAALRAFITEVEIAQGEPPSVEPTVAELFEQWMANKDHRASTKQGYRSKIDGYLAPAFGHIKVSALRPDAIDGYYRQWERQGLATATVRQLHAILSGAFSQAVKWGWVGASPAARATPPSVHRANRRSISFEELTAIVNLAMAGAEYGSGDVLPVAIGLLALTGCRRGELAALRWSEVEPVDEGRGVVAIKHSLTVLTGQPWKIGPTKTHQERRVELGAQGVKMLRARRNAQEQWAARVGVKLVANPFVLSRTADGSDPCRPDTLSHQFGELVAKLWPSTGGKPAWHLHSLRHYAATELIGAGMDVRTVANRLGHADASTTLKIYAHPLSERDREAATIASGTLPDAWG